MSDLTDILADLDRATELLNEVRDIFQSVKIDEEPSAENQAIYAEKRLQKVELSIDAVKFAVELAISRGVTESVSAPAPTPEPEPEPEDDFEPTPGVMVYDVDDDVQEDL